MTEFSRDELRTLIEIIEENVFDPHCVAINDHLYPHLNGTCQYPFNWNQYMRVVDLKEERTFPEVSGCPHESYFEIYRKLVFWRNDINER